MTKGASLRRNSCTWCHRACAQNLLGTHTINNTCHVRYMLPALTYSAGVSDSRPLNIHFYDHFKTSKNFIRSLAPMTVYDTWISTRPWWKLLCSFSHFVTHKTDIKYVDTRRYFHYDCSLRLKEKWNKWMKDPAEREFMDFLGNRNTLKVSSCLLLFAIKN